MCGIAGFPAGDDSSQIAETLIEGLVHRGPDGSTWRTHSQWSLVQTRLAVVDLSERVQYPMRSEDGLVALVFNGEIYNHLALRGQLERAGHRFATGCDAEVAVHGWEEWGEGLFGRLSGMFALALSDQRTGELILARDRLGIKPLVHTTSKRFAFASDAIALVRAGLSGGDVDSDAIAEFMYFHYVPHPLTGLLDVRQVEPGTLVRRAADGTMRTRRWTSHPFSSPASDSSPPTADDLDRAIRAAVERHLQADVEIGILLSGGVDSRLVLAMAVDAGARPRTFTVSFAGHGDYDEASVAAATAAAFRVEHREVQFSLGFEEALDSVAMAYDQPLADASAIATILVSRVAREQVTVGLSGTGGDDLFAGYSRHRAHLIHSPLSRLPTPILERLAGLRAAPGAERLSAARLARSYVARLAEAGHGDAYDQYLALAASHSGAAATGLLGLQDAGARTGVATRLRLRDGGEASLLSGLQAFELRSYLPGDLLAKEDRATMAVGLEGRVPLLDLEVLELAERTTPRQRATLRTGKRLLREVAANRLAGAPAPGRKRGFAVPLAALLQGHWRVPARQWLHGCDSTVFSGPQAAEKMISGALTATDVWALSALAAWEARVGAARRATAVSGT